MELALAIGGTVAIAAGWIAIRRGTSLWLVMPPVLAALGIVSLVVGRPEPATDVSAATAIVVGIGSGLLLFVATRLFIAATTRWTAFQHDTGRVYAPSAVLSALPALMLSAASALGEELFWRGLTQPRLTQALGTWGGAAATWLAAIAANAPSGSLSIVLGTIVGGALWVILAAWTGGVLASLFSHLVWTVLMLRLPPPRARAWTDR